MEAKERMRDHPLNRSLRENTPFYIPSTGFGRITYLMSATLIVVPDNILSQWHNEITMYCASPLRVLLLRVGDKAPSMKFLAIYFDVG
jgi:hypothetical protein